MKNINADILGKLLVVQQYVEVLPDEASIASFVRRAIAEVPGVGKVGLCVGGVLYPPDAALEEARRRFAEAGETPAPIPPVEAGRIPGTDLVPLATFGRPYGFLAIGIDDPAAFEPYQGIVRNVAGVVAATLEARDHVAQILRAKNERAARVTERAAESDRRGTELTAGILARARSQRALGESEEKFRLLGANAPDAIIIADPDGNVLYWNPAAERIFGYSAAEMLGQSAYATLAPERYRESARAAWTRFQSTGRGAAVGKTLEVSALRKGGAEFPIELSVSAMRLDDAWHAIGIARDITERKKADAVREELARIVESSVDGIIGEDLSGIVTSWNRGAEKIYGWLASEMIGKPITVLIPPELQTEFDTIIRKVEAGEVIKHYETERISKGGVRMQVSLSLSPIRDRLSGKITSASVIARDVTERKRAERELAASEASLREAERIAHVGHWDWDVSTGRQSWSDELDRIFGVDKDAVRPSYQAFLDCLHPEDRDRVAAAIDRSLKECVPFSVEHRIVLPAGPIRHVEARGEVKVAGGKPVRVLGTVLDITERKRNEEQLERSNRTLKMVSQGNRTLVHAASERELLDETCRIVAEAGGYPLVWIGLKENDPAGEVRVVAQGGFGGAPPDVPKLMASEEEMARSPVGTVIRTGRAIVIPDIASDTTFPALRGACSDGHLRSCVVLPLGVTDHEAFGALNVFSAAANAFDDPEIAMLEEVVSDLSFGLAALRTRSERDQAVKDRAGELVRLNKSLEDAVGAISATLEARDPYTAGHHRRVTKLAVAIAREMKLPDKTIMGLRMAASIHDIGKVKIPSEILNFPGPLGHYERMLIEEHCQTGYGILKDVDFPWPVADIVLQHHERLDGSGYPRKLKGDAILPETRIVSIADVVDAMASHRPYRAALGIDAALQEVSNGIKFDAAAASACVKLFREGNFKFD